ncbi:FAD-binding oxidoreductase [Rhodoferax sp. GW822-FHT02A01]|uniref:NAD(P)/FAD-dependent oxidoreductase n=1 Tax=Rhodoferax sp. GW822-FHT02A01 TaxID=3141537 RepID=UPI00315C9404
MTGSVRNILSHPTAQSLWSDTAIPAPPTPALQESISVEVLIVGAGYTGLSAALHLAERGASVCVLDAHEPGWGASGRNGGQVNPTLKHDPDELTRIYGAEHSEKLIEAVSGSADLVFGLIARHAIDCQPVRAGWLQMGYTEKAVASMHARARQWERRGARVEMLDRTMLAQRVGSSAFAGGWLDGRAGSIQPLSYARGLTRAALNLKVQVHGRSPVTNLVRRGAQWTATTAGGATVTAAQVVLATNGYTDGLWPGLAKTVLAANSFIVATEPLGVKGDLFLPGGETASTSQRLLLYFRKDAQGRLLMGGRGHFRDPESSVDFRHLERAVALTFPQLGPVRYQYRWSGRVAITRDFMPHMHQPATGITMALGYNGRGIALATLMGRQVADMLNGTRGTEGGIPVTPLRPIPLHGLQRAYVAAGVAWYSLLDKLSG